MKFRKWKKDMKKVHNKHVKTLIVVNDPKTSDDKKRQAQKRLRFLEKVEMDLESKKFR